MLCFVWSTRSSVIKITVVSYILSLWFLQEVTSGSALGHCSSIFAIKKSSHSKFLQIVGSNLDAIHLKLLKLLNSSKVVSIRTEIYIRLAIKNSQKIYSYLKTSFLSWHPEYLFSVSIKVFIWYESVVRLQLTFRLLGYFFIKVSWNINILKILIYSNRHGWFWPPPFLSCLIPKSWIQRLFRDSLLGRWRVYCVDCKP